MLLRKIVELWKRFPRTLRSVWIAGFCVYCFGGGLNMLVISGNYGKMPVPVIAEEFFVIYPKYYWVALEMTPDRMLIAGKAKDFVVMTENSRFKALADRFYLVSPINVYNHIPAWLTIQFIRSDVPLLGQEMQASIGDIIGWIADILFVLAAIATIVFIFVQGFKYQRNKACGVLNP